MNMEIRDSNNEPSGTKKKMRNVSNIDQPLRLLEAHAGFIAAPRSASTSDWEFYAPA
jgi:hypothetical protein